MCGELLAVSLIHSPQNQIGFRSDPVQDLCCISAHGNIKEQSLVICSIISRVVPQGEMDQFWDESLTKVPDVTPQLPHSSQVLWERDFISAMHHE